MWACRWCTTSCGGRREGGRREGGRREGGWGWGGWGWWGWGVCHRHKHRLRLRMWELDDAVCGLVGHVAASRRCWEHMARCCGCSAWPWLCSEPACCSTQAGGNCCQCLLLAGCNCLLAGAPLGGGVLFYWTFSVNLQWGCAGGDLQWGCAGGDLQWGCAGGDLDWRAQCCQHAAHQCGH